MQILQEKTIEITDYIQCSVKITESITKCGKWYQGRNAQVGVSHYSPIITRDNCEEMHKSNTYRDSHNRATVVTIKDNRGETFQGVAGSIDDNTCEGASFTSHLNVAYDNVSVRRHIIVELSTGKAEVNLKQRTIHLQRTFECKFDEGSCVTPSGTAFWTRQPKSQCTSDDIIIIFEGILTRETRSNPNGSVVVSYALLDSNDQQFIIQRQERTTRLCGVLVYKTQADKLFLLEQDESSDNFIRNSQDFPVMNLDMTIYFGIKLSTAIAHVATQLSHLHRELNFQKCSQEAMGALHILTIGQLVNQRYLPTDKFDEFIQPAGEILKIIRCAEIKVQLLPTEQCSKAWPVIYNQEKLFIQPLTRILTNKANPTPCNDENNIFFNINDTIIYRNINGSLRTTESRPEAFPIQKFNWTFHSINLINSGIYRKELVEEFNNKIKFGKIKGKKVHNSVTTYTNDHQSKAWKPTFADHNSIDVVNHMINKAKDAIKTFGTYSAAAIGTYIMVTAVKKVVETFNITNLILAIIKLMTRDKEENDVENQ